MNDLFTVRMEGTNFKVTLNPVSVLDASVLLSIGLYKISFEAQSYIIGKLRHFVLVTGDLALTVWTVMFIPSPRLQCAKYKHDHVEIAVLCKNN